MPPEVLKEYGETEVLIASTYEQEILEQLHAMGKTNVHTIYGFPSEGYYPHREMLMEYVKRSAQNLQKNSVSEKEIKRVYKIWNNHFTRFRIERETPAEYLDNTSNPIKILDYGFGCGTLVLNLLLRGYDAYGIDLDEGKKAFYNQKITDLNFPDEWKDRCNLYDGERIPYDDEEFDVVFSTQVLEHVQDIGSSIREMLRVCKTGGILRLELPNYDGTYEGHYRIDFGKPLYGHKDEFKVKVKELGYNEKEVDNINFINLKEITAILNDVGGDSIEVIDLNLEKSLDISLLVKKI